jgi:hypothetical protein
LVLKCEDQSVGSKFAVQLNTRSWNFGTDRTQSCHCHIDSVPTAAFARDRERADVTVREERGESQAKKELGIVPLQVSAIGGGAM